MNKRIHFTTCSGSDQNGEWHSSSACGLNEDSNADWDGTGSRDKVTCKRCLTQMVKPRKPSTIGLHKEHPILFSGPMVRAILEGQKTVTRRPLKGHHIPRQIGSEDEEMRWMATVQNHPRWGFGAFGATEAECAAELAMYGGCPYGQRWERLWVRETFYAFGRWETRFSQKKGRDEWHFVDMTIEQFKAYQFEPPQTYRLAQRSEAVPTWWKRPAIFMPRAASRILLEITEVRVERLQDISREGCIAEGPDLPVADHLGRAWHVQFQRLWESTGGDWDANPWVWVVEFKRVTP